MKTKLLFIALLVGASLLSFAQNLVLHYDGQALEPNETVVILGEETASELVIELEVENVSAGDIETNLQRYETDIMAGHVNTMCWAGQCYPPFVGLPPNTVVIAGGTTTSLEDGFSGHVQPGGIVGTSTIAYTFFDVNNSNDSVQVIVKFAAGTTGIDDLNTQSLEVSTYPNPATDVLNFNIDTELNEVVTYELLNITGSVVRSEAAQSNSAKFNVSDLAEGLYIYRVSTDKEVLKTGRVVIKH